MSNTTNLQLPFIDANQNQKYVTHNEALTALDALVMIDVVSNALSAPPGSPADGQRWIVAPGGSGAWSGKDGNIAAWQSGAWNFYFPNQGFVAYIANLGALYVYDGTNWNPVRGAGTAAGNRLLNATFTLNQRGATAAASGAYGFDRWYVLTETGSVNLSGLTDPETGAIAGIRLAQPDASAKRIGLAQAIESANVRDLRSALAILSGRARLSVSGSIRYALLEWAGTVDVPTKNVVNNWASTTFTPGNFFINTVNVIATGVIAPGASVWGALAGISGAFGASMTNAIVFVWSDAQLAQNVTLDLDRMQLEAGTAATPFAFRPIQEELARCQRYYEKSYGQGVAPGSVATAGISLCFLGGLPSAAYTGAAFVSFRSTKAKVPAVTGYSPSTGAGGKARDGAGSADVSVSIVGANVADSGFTWSAAAAGAAASLNLQLQWTAEAEL